MMYPFAMDNNYKVDDDDYNDDENGDDDDYEDEVDGGQDVGG